jgi:hypothetical protein
VLGRGIGAGADASRPSSRISSAAADVPRLLMAPAMMATVWHMTFYAIQPLPLEQIKAAHLAMITAVLREPVAPG